MPQPTSRPAGIFVTGFGPFLNVTDNPSAKVAEALGLPYQVLEVSFDAADAFVAGLDPAGFGCLLMIGVARGRKHVCPELFARNQIGHTKDVHGQDRFGPIEEGAPLLLEGGLWTPEILSFAIDEPTIRTSYDAGTYLCNYIYYRALRRFPDRRVGFLHVPDVDAIPLEETIRIARLLVEKVAASTPADK